MKRLPFPGRLIAGLVLALGSYALPALPALAADAKPTGDPSLPVAPVRDVVENFFGTEVHDPYRYFEDIKSPEVADWMKAYSDRADRILKSMPGRAQLLRDITKYDDSASARVGSVTRLPGDVYFYERLAVGENQFKLYMRHGLDGKEVLLVDPEELTKKNGKPHAINYYTVSPNGRYLAYGISQQGTEAASLYVKDLKTGKLMGTPISRGDFASVDWSADSHWMHFNLLQEMKPGMPATEKYQKSRVLRLHVGAPITRAKLLFGLGAPGVEIGPAEIPFTSTTLDGRWVFGQIQNGTQREFTLYVAPYASVAAGHPKWKRVFDASANITGLAYYRDTLYLRSHDGAPRSKVLALGLHDGDIGKARVVVPESDQVLTNLAAAADGLYVERRDGNVKRLYKLGWGGDASLKEVALPVEGSFQLSSDEGGPGAADPRLPGLVLDLQGWTRARQIYAVAADGKVENTGLQPQGAYDAPKGITATEVVVRSWDGALVPMSIIHKDGVKLDGSNPALLYGYASYGITEEPFYSTGRLAWLDHGGVYAVANPRGSSVYGEDWYRGGFQQTKPNTWKDFIACAEYLVSQGYTSPAKLGILGGSAGGILVGRAMTERPDLFAAVIPAVGVLDTVRAEVTPNGVPNIPEFGTRTTEAGFKALYEMSTYHHIKDGVKYPAVMFLAGVNDPRVEVWQTTKTAARLMAANAGNRPILVRLDYEAGHGIGNTKKQVLEQRADIYSFLLWQMGAPEFQPK